MNIDSDRYKKENLVEIPPKILNAWGVDVVKASKTHRSSIKFSAELAMSLLLRDTAPEAVLTGASFDPDTYSITLYFVNYGEPTSEGRQSPEKMVSFPI